jgi:hypothetical protein
MTSTSIHTLIPDIYDLMKRKDGWFTDALSKSLSADISERLRSNLGEAKSPAKLRLSKMGPTCPKALWCSIRNPSEAQPLEPWAEIKYSYGHVLEALLITLAKASGHEVTGEQDELVVDGISGHRDCVIDGYVVDVKSASSRSFQKFRDGLLANDDPFGYLDQLDGYIIGSIDDPLVRHKDCGFLLAVDKQLGHLCLYEHRHTPERAEALRKRIAYYKAIVENDTPPECTCRSIEDGKSGNMKLDVAASYNAFKYFCNPNLRTFLYADGPRFLTKVVRRPTRQDGTPVPEIDRHGNLIY